MEAAFAELPLAIFTTLAPLGAGAFVVLAGAFLMADFSEAQLKRVDALTFVPLGVVLVGFAASFMHLASPMNAPYVLSGIGSSPLSNEIFVGSAFLVLALVYAILAVLGKLSHRARTGFALVVALAGLVFAVFTGMAYVIETISSWNTFLVPLQVVGFSLLGGAALGLLVLVLAGAFDGARKGSFRVGTILVVAVGLALALIGLCGQVALVNSQSTVVVAGAVLVAQAIPALVCAVACLVLAGIAAVVSFSAKKPLPLVLSATCFAIAGVFAARLVFYALQLSVGL